MLLTSEARFERTPDGALWGPPAYGRDLWSRYLEVFSSVVVAARVSDVQSPAIGSVEASVPEVKFCALPAYSGLSGLARNIRRVHRTVSAALCACSATVVRAPSPIAFLVSKELLAKGRPYGAEIVGDPDRVFSQGAFQHPLRTPIRRLATVAQRRVSRGATAVLFVTARTLQQKYPAGGLSFAASDVDLDDDAFRGDGPRPWTRAEPFRLVTVGGLDQPFKGTASLLHAVAELHRRGATVRLRIVGAGRLMNRLQQSSRDLGIDVAVEFTGQLDRSGVRSALDDSHLFVLPSLTEGLPRALVEAMARGTPAVATQVGGVPELLPPDCLVPPAQPRALADRIEQFMADDCARRRRGQENRRVACRHHQRLHAIVRKDFLRVIRDASSAGARREVRCA